MNTKRHFYHSLTAVLLILIAGIAVYSNTFHVPFVLDDFREITNNSFITKLDNFFANPLRYKIDNPNRFVAIFTFALNYHFQGLDVTGYHLVNLGIHLITALLVYALLRQTFHTPYFRANGSESQVLEETPPSFFSSLASRERFIPLLAALLFTVHPIQTQAVTYIVQRETSLAVLFYLLSMALYVQMRLGVEVSRSASLPKKSAPSNNGKRNVSALARVKMKGLHALLLAGAVMCAVLAMKTKEIAFTLPLVVLLYEVFFFRGPWRWRLCFLLPILLTLPVVPMSLLGISGLPDFSPPEIFVSARKVDSPEEARSAVRIKPAGEVSPGNDVSPDGNFFSATGDRLRSHTVMPRHVYLFTQFRVLVTYLRLLVLPVNQNIDHQYPFYGTFFTMPVFLSFLFLTALFGLAAYLFRATRTVDASPSPAVRDPDVPSSSRRDTDVDPALRLVAFGILWFFITLGVESSIVPLPDVIMEHRLYLPGFGTSAVFATLLYLLVGKVTAPYPGGILFPVATVLVLTLGFAAYQRNHVWGDRVSLWEDAVAKSPERGRTNNNLGVALAKAGRTKEAIEAFSKAIEVDPYYFRAYYNLADLYLAMGRPELSLPLLQTYLQLVPDEKKGYVLYGASLMRSGRFPEVISFLEQNIDRVGGNAEAHFYLGSAYAFVGNRKAAQRELNIVSSLDAGLAATLSGLLGRNSPHGFSHGSH